jgi:secreted trypsin-like serine protease
MRANLSRRICASDAFGAPLALSASMRLSALALAAAAGCMGPLPVGIDRAAIIGGSNDTGDPAIVVLYMTTPGQQGGALCTGEVISPHVVLTAAHCTGGENPSVTNATWRVFTGTDFATATAANLLPVKEAHYNPKFDVNNLAGGNDVGVAILQSPLSITPLPINRTPLDATYAGQPVRLVGYGLDNAQAQTGAGVKRQTSTTLTDVSPLLLHFSDGAHETCNGDSGGPALMTIGGREVIVGLTSYGDAACAMGGYDTRVDAMLAFIDSYVQANDPPGAQSSPPSPSGGTQAPSAPPATTSPPSGSMSGGVGESCSIDADCQSALCGLGDHGNRVCFPANANNGVNGGCSVGGDEDPGLVLAFLVGLALGLGRSLRRRTR